MTQPDGWQPPHHPQNQPDVPQDQPDVPQNQPDVPQDQPDAPPQDQPDLQPQEPYAQLPQQQPYGQAPQQPYAQPPQQPYAQPPQQFGGQPQYPSGQYSSGQLQPYSSGQLQPYGSGPQASYGGPPPQYAYPPVPPKNDLGVWSLVTGILSWILCPVILGVVAIIMGHAAKRAVREGQANNPGLSTAGLILGWINVGLIGGFLLAWLLFALVAFLGAGLAVTQTY
ncbi:DUF4190 domain-containing protein [Promicromonospora sp. Populi]|uniref:DUF4190 domain-containing protein n=1 Tax=Promicromonospora sp. Populi TaxID=3239420 RepID=UPI0034E2C884